MLKFRRLLEILHTIGRYRLDKLLDKENIPTRFRILLVIFRLYPASKFSRGYSLRKAFEELGPIFVKFGQLLSTRPDIVPADIVEELDHLQDNVAPFPGQKFRAIVEQALGDNIDNLFREFSENPLASASVAQVHTAELKTGEQVVVKVIRPEIEKIISKDINLLRFIARIIERYSTEGKRLRIAEIVEDYRNTIYDELDLMHEAANASQLRRNFLGSDMLYIPEVYWDYTRRNVMVMERIYGISATDIKALNAQNTDLKLLAERGVEIFFTQVFKHNFFHADMHPGNVFISRRSPDSPSYIAVDMAIVGSLTREDQYYLARNLLAMFRRDYRQVAELHVLSGWVPRETSVNGFESAIRTVCEPIFEKPIKDISFGEALITLFRTARRYNMEVQPQLVLLQKTLLNIEGMGRQLYPDLNLWDTAHPYLERWIKERFHPKALLKELKYHSPEWMEKFPQMPHLLFDTLREVKSLAEIAPELKTASNTINENNTRNVRRRRRMVIAISAWAAGIYSAWPMLGTVSPEAASLFIIGALALILN